MKKANPFDTIIQQLYQKQRMEENGQAPDFSLLFDRAQQKQRKMKRQKWLVVSLALLILSLIGWSFVDHEAPTPHDSVPIAHASLSLYKVLMKDGKIITNDIHFDYDQASIRPTSMSVIQSIAEMMEAHPELQLRIEGHTDNTGASEYNRKLSAARASAVKDALVALAIEPSRLQAQGFGEARPISHNKTESGRARNRRVEFVKN